MGYISFFLCALVASSAVAGPVNIRGGPCARHCTESSKFKYQPGTTYVYDYEADTATTLQGTTKDESRLHLKARVEIDIISKCDLVMRLKSINLEQSEPSNPRSRSRAAGLEELQQALERRPLRFSFQDGVVDVVCPSDDEEAPLMNIKRGILSTLQNSMSNWDGTEDVIENDVAGKCTTTYQSMAKGWNSITIQRTKDFATCTDRFNTNSAIQADFHGGMGTSTTPLVKGEQQCEQTLSNGLLQKTVCTEQHILRPFSRQENGAVTRVAQVLTYKTYQPTKATGFDYSSVQRDLFFDHKTSILEDGRRETEAEMAFADLCATARPDIKASVPAKFTRVVYTFRNIDYRSMNGIFRRIDQICPNSKKAKKFFLDALPMVGNAAAVRMMKEMVENNDVNKGDAETWFTTIAFLSKPTKEMIKELTPILDGRYDQALLGVSAMINTFCKNHHQCDQVTEVQQAVHKIASILGNNCDGNKKKVILALKAIGNIGVAHNVESILHRCVATKDNEIRMAAIEAYRRFPCEISRDHLIRMLTEKQENVEIRIKSYLAAMKCQTSFLLETIETMLREEKINQVGSFVWSHLSNLAKHKGPHTRDIRRLTSDLYLMNKFVVDIRKYSRNVQTGVFFNGIDTGFDMGGNLIFTPESYIPRSAMLNMTIDIFGHKVNLFEVEGRAEGFEQILESMFGPKASGVHARNSDSRVNEMEKTFNAREIYYKEPTAALDFKIFGNTLWHKKMNQGSIARGELSFMDVLAELAKEQDVEISKSLMFLDTTYTVPTGCGLPLHVAINGTATVDMKVRGKFDVRSLDAIDVRGHIQPSGAVEISTIMSVDAIVAKTGIKVVATLHSSNVMDGLLEVRKGNLIRAQFNMPREQMEVISVQSKILLLNGDKEQEQMGVTDRRSRWVKCSGEYTDRLLGVELCGEISLPSSQRRNVPAYPFSGPATMRVYIRKTDPSLTSYNFETKWTPERKHFMVMFNTPESRVDREVSLDFHVNERDRAVSVKVRTPVKRMNFNGKYLNEDNEKKLDISMSVDDMEKFAVQAALNRDETDSGIRYMPTLMVQGPNGRLLNLRGVSTIRYGQKWSTELNIEDLTVKPITIRGDISMGEKNRYEGQMSVDSPLLEVSAQGYTQLSNSLSSKLTIEYKFPKGRKEKLDMTAKFRDMSASSLLKYSGSASFQNTAMPEFSTAFWWETQLTSGHIENTLEATFGDGRVRKVHKITFQEILRYSGNIYNNEIDATLKMTYPENNLDLVFNMAHKNTPRSFNNKMVLGYKPSRELTTIVDFKLLPDPLVANGEIQIMYPGRDIKLMANVNEAKPNEYETTLTAQLQRGKQMKIVGALRNKSDRRQILMEGNVEMMLPSTRPVSLSGSVKNFQGQSTIAGSADFGRGSYGFRGEHSSPSQYNHRVAGAINVPGQTYTGEAALLAGKEKFSGKLDINLPTKRHLVGSLDITEGLRQVAFDLMWDADRDQNRRITVNTKYQIQGPAFHGSAMVKCPAHTVRGTVDADYQGRMSSGNLRVNARSELEWGRGQVISMDLSATSNLQSSRSLVEGDIKIRTPFSGFKNLDVKLKHNSRMPEWNSELVAEWENKQRFSFATSGKYTSSRHGHFMEGRINVITPFRSLEHFSMEHVCEGSPNAYSTNNEVIWNRNRKIGFGFYGSNVGNVRAGLNFTSPFETLNQLSASLTHEQSRDNVKMHVDALWNNRNQISASLDGKSTRTGDKRTCEINVKVGTPFRGFEKLSSQVAYSDSRDEISGEAQIGVNFKKITAGFMGSKANTPYGRNVEGKIFYTTPFANYENVEIRVTHSSDREKFTVNLEAKMPYNKWASVKVQGEQTSPNNLKATALVTSSFPGLERISSDLIFRTQGPKIFLTGQATYGRQQMKVDGSGHFTRDRRVWNLDGNVVLNTPFRGYEENKLTIKHNWQDKKMDSQFDLSFGRQNLSATHSLQYDDIYNFKNSIKVMRPYSLIFVVNHHGDRGQFKHESELEWARNKRATAVLELRSLSNRNKRNLNAKLNIKTPFYNFDSLAIDASYESNHESVKPRINVQWNGFHQINVEGDFFNPSSSKIDAKLMITSTFRNFEAINLEGNVDLSQKQKTIAAYLQKRELFKILLNPSNDNGELEFSIYSPVEGCNNLKFKGSYDFSANQNTGNVIMGCDDQSNIILNGQIIKNADGHGIALKFKTPLRDMENLGVNGRYSASRSHFSGQMNLLGAKNKNMALKIDSEITRHGLKLKTEAETPFRGFESMLFQLVGESRDTRKAITTIISYGTNNIQFNGVFECNKNNRGSIDIQLQSPFKNFEEISLNGNLEVNPNDFKTEANFQWYPRRKISTSLTGRTEPMEVVFILETPFDLKTMKTVVNLENRGKYYGVTANCEWNNNKKIELTGSLEYNGNQFLEGKMKLNTPFRGYHAMSLDSTFKNERNKLDGKISMVTPFTSMPKVEANGQYRKSSDDHAVTLNLATPNSNFVVSGNAKMYSARRMEGSINIETPMRGFEKFSLIANFDGDDWGSLKGDATVSGDSFFHKILANFRNLDGIVEGDARIESSSLNNKAARLNFRTNVKDPQNLEGSLELEAYNKKHSVLLANKRNHRGMESELKVRSPFVPRNELSVKTAFKKSRNIQGSIVAEVNSEKHVMEFLSNMNDRQVSGKLRIQCSLLPIPSLNLEGKLGMPSDNSFEGMLQAITPKDSHLATCLVKIEPGNFESQLTISTPLLPSNTATIISKLELSSGFLEGFLAFNTPRSESRLAVNSRITANNVDGTITLNTPFEPLKMMRIDGKLNKRRNQLAGSLDFQSSIDSWRKMSVSGKTSIDGDDTIDISANLRLPSRNYNNIDFLGTIHKNKDLSSVTPRFTLSMANRKYTLYGQYINTNDVLGGNVGYEIDARKIGDIALKLKNIRNSKTLEVSIITPFRGYESYEGSSEYNVENHRRVIQISLKDPRNKNINIRGSALFHSILNFNVDLTASTPFTEFQQFSGRIQQVYRQNQLSSTVELAKNNRDKIALHLKHNSDHATFSLDTPFDSLPSLKMAYTSNSDKGHEDKVDVEYAGHKVFLLHLTKGQGANENSRDIRVEVIPLSIKLHLNGKSLPLGSEILVKITIGDRSMAFSTLYQSSPSHFSHSSKLTMDEKSGQAIAYEIRKTENSRKEKEVYGRLDLPIRSFEVRGQSTPSGNGRLRNIDFYWDAARDTNKHVMVTGLMEDLGNREAKGHKMQLTFSHPRLSKDIVARSHYTVSPTEAMGKLELEYSRHNQHNLMVEARAQNLARSRRDTHYTASLMARHPATNTDFQLKGEVVNNGQEAGAQVKVNYMDVNRQQRLAEVKTKILKLKKEIEILTKANEKSMGLTGRMFNRDNELTLALEEQKNGEAPIHSHFRFNKHHKNMDLNLTTADRETFHVRASMPENLLHCEVSHTRNLQKQNDVLLNLGLKESNLLFSKLKWRPEMLAEAKHAIMKKYSELTNGVMRAIRNSNDVFWSETNTRSAMVKRSLNQEFNPFYDEVERELGGLNRDYQSTKRQLNKMHRNNDFYMHDVTEGFGKATDFIANLPISEISVPQYVVRLADDFMDYWNTLNQRITNFVLDAQIFVVFTYDGVFRYVAEIGERVLDYAVDKLGFVFNKIAERAGGIAMYLAEKFDDVLDNYAPSLKETYHNIIEGYINALEWINENYVYLKNNLDVSGLLNLYNYMTEEFLPQSRERIIDTYNNFNSHPKLIYIRDLMGAAYEQSKFLMGNLGLDDLASRFIREAIDRVQEMAWGTVQHLVDQVTDIRNGINYVYEPKKGELSLEMRLPQSHSSLGEIFDMDKYSQLASQLKNKYFVGKDFSIWDAYYKYKNYASPSYWVPPFDAQAMIAGSQHFLTFDQFHFDFAGECSYLLARDFVNGTFTVTINYVRDGQHVVKKSLNVFTRGISIEIDNDYKVTLDGNNVELPQVVGSTIVTREEGTIDLVDPERYHIRCNMVHDICTMRMSGFYFGKTGGLFGVYNYEPALDMMTPENTVVPNLEEYADSWKVGTARCQKNNMAQRATDDYEAQVMCKELFENNDSIFRSCFKQVNPESYLRMCMNDVGAVRGKLRHEKLCTSAAAYTAQCNFNHVYVQMPKHCVRCEKHDGSMVEAGDIVKITPSETVQAADIVFVVEEQRCNRDMIRMMSKLAQGIEGNLKAKGYRSIRFAVVGFGGAVSKPHIVTADSNIFGTVRSIDSALSSVAFGDGPSNIFLALRYAASLPFKMGATKSILLAKCSPCQVDTMKADYSEMLRTMLDGDITLHLLSDHDFAIKASTSKASKAKRVLGLDRKYAYTMKDVKDSGLTGDADLLAQVRIPKDLCVPLALEVGGSFFSSQRLIDSKRGPNKKAMEVLAKRVVKTAEPSECQVCECIATKDGVGKSFCQRCVSPIVAHTFSDEISPMYNDNYEDQNDNSEDFAEENYARQPAKSKVKGLRRKPKY